MSLESDLISLLGSPFVDETNRQFKFTNSERTKLYNLAYKNKVGLFLLNRLKAIGELSPLEDTYNSDMTRYIETMRTAVDISTKLKQVTNEFAVFKFLKPYPHTPSDVDVLFFSRKAEYKKTTDYLLSNGYSKIGACPSQTVVYDLRGGLDQVDKRTVDGKKGGKYYIDLYNNVSASHVIYVNKETLSKYRINIDSSIGKLQTLHPVADLTVVLAHSIIPEQLFTLGDYYTALHYINGMDTKDLDNLVQLFLENHIVNCGIMSLIVTSYIHNRFHGFVPEKVEYILNKFGVEMLPQKDIIDDKFSLPYRYNAPVLLKVIAERMGDKAGFQSIITQMVCSLDPRLAKWVVYNIILRRIRETY
jgi:hypothetical protein